jgi:hypothetical protein
VEGSGGQRGVVAQRVCVRVFFVWEMWAGAGRQRQHRLRGRAAAAGKKQGNAGRRRAQILSIFENAICGLLLRSASAPEALKSNVQLCSSG